MSATDINGQQLLADYASRASVVNSYPAVMYIESTKGCPYTCIMCNVPEMYGKRSQDISPALLEKISPYLKHLEILAIHGSGEPLLSKSMDFFIKASRSNGCYLHMNTTGFYLTPKLSDQLLEAKLSIRFSLHSATPETYRRIMGNDLERVSKNIAYLVRRSEEVGCKENDFWLSYLVMKETIGEIDRFLHLASEVGIHKVRFMSLNPNAKILRGATRADSDFTFRYFEQFDRGVQNTFLDRLPEIKALADSLGITLESGSMESAAKEHVSVKRVVYKIQRRFMPNQTSMLPLRKRHGSCLAPWVGQVLILLNGDVELCCRKPYTLGNLHEQSFEEIWNGNRVRYIREEFQKGVYPRVCGYCRGFHADEYPGQLFEQFGQLEACAT